MRTSPAGHQRRSANSLRLAWLASVALAALAVSVCAGEPATNSPSITPSPYLRERLSEIPGLRSTTPPAPRAPAPAAAAVAPPPQLQTLNPKPAEPNPPTSSTVPTAKALLPSSMSDLDDTHKLAIGDRLSFRILEDLEDPKEPLDPKSLIVTDSGELEVPYLGRYPAENKTCRQLARELKAALEKDYYYQATVIVAVDLMTKSRGKVYLVGPVRVPGPQDIPSDEVLTLSKAIMRAGGFNDFADRKNVKVTRKGRPGELDKRTFTVDVGDILDKGRIERDLPLESGDIILVPERAIRF